MPLVELGVSWPNGNLTGRHFQELGGPFGPVVDLFLEKDRKGTSTCFEDVFEKTQEPQETVVMPDTAFIYGLPGTDSFIKNLDPCLKAFMPKLGPKMEASYYAAPLQLVDPNFPSVVAKMREDKMRVLALTSRRTGVQEKDQENLRVIEFLNTTGVKLSALPGGFGNDTVIGGIIFAGGEKVNKGMIIKQLLEQDAKAALVDNTLKKLLQ